MASEIMLSDLTASDIAANGPRERRLRKNIHGINQLERNGFIYSLLFIQKGNKET